MNCHVRRQGRQPERRCRAAANLAGHTNPARREMVMGAPAAVVLQVGSSAVLFCRSPFKPQDFPAIGLLCQNRRLVDKRIDRLVAAIADHAQL